MGGKTCGDVGAGNTVTKINSRTTAAPDKSERSTRRRKKARATE